MLEFNLSMEFALQDMICIIMEKENLSEAEAIKLAINKDNRDRIIQTGWASTAVDLWGHADPDRKWKKMEKLVINVDLDLDKEFLLTEISAIYDIEIEEALGYFLIFTMENMGYHI